MATDNNNPAIIDINAKPSPAVLAGLLGINVQMTYQGRQDGKLPPNSDASYRECITHYINFWKSKSGSKISNVAEAAVRQKIELDRAKTENEWLNIKEKKGQLLDVNIMAETFEPIFLHIRTQLVSISRKFPETQEVIDKSLEELFHLGEKVFKEGMQDLDGFIDAKMAEVLDLDEEEQDTPVLNSFGDYAPVEAYLSKDKGTSDDNLM